MSVTIHNPDRLLPTSVAAELLGMRERTLRWWAKTGRIPAIRAGVKLWKFRRSDVVAIKARCLAERTEAA